MWSAWIFERMKAGKKEINKMASRGVIIAGTPTRHLTPFRGIMEQSVLLLSSANSERWRRRPQHSLLTIMKKCLSNGYFITRGRGARGSINESEKRRRWTQSGTDEVRGSSSHTLSWQASRLRVDSQRLAMRHNSWVSMAHTTAKTCQHDVQWSHDHFTQVKIVIFRLRRQNNSFSATKL